MRAASPFKAKPNGAELSLSGVVVFGAVLTW
jgi:hypothetical protein